MLKERGNGYDIQGPLGPKEHKLPVCEVDMRAKLNDPTFYLKSRWGKKNAADRPKTLDKQSAKYKPSRMAASTCKITRLPGDLCLMHARNRLAHMDKLEAFSVEIYKLPNDYMGKDFGLTAGIFIQTEGTLRYDIVVVWYFFPNSLYLIRSILAQPYC